MEAAEGSSVPVYLCRVSADFPSPTSDYVVRDIDLNDWLIRNKLATYIVRVVGAERGWEMRRQRLSPRCTTRLDEVLRVKAC